MYFRIGKSAQLGLDKTLHPIPSRQPAWHPTPDTMADRDDEITETASSATNASDRNLGAGAGIPKGTATPMGHVQDKDEIIRPTGRRRRRRRRSFVMAASPTTTTATLAIAESTTTTTTTTTLAAPVPSILKRTEATVSEWTETTTRKRSAATRDGYGRGVSFNEAVMERRIRPRNQLTLRERETLWYSTTEYSRIGLEVMDEVDLWEERKQKYHQKDTPQSATPSTTTTTAVPPANDQQRCYHPRFRGMESLTEQGGQRKMMFVSATKEAVLAEQSRQRKARMEDPVAIAVSYGKHTRMSKKDAFRRAKLDEKMAKLVYSQAKNEEDHDQDNDKKKKKKHNEKKYNRSASRNRDDRNDKSTWRDKRNKQDGKKDKKKRKKQNENKMNNKARDKNNKKETNDRTRRNSTMRKRLGAAGGTGSTSFDDPRDRIPVARGIRRLLGRSKSW